MGSPGNTASVDCLQQRDAEGRDKIEGSQPYLEGFRVSEVKHWAGKHPLRKQAFLLLSGPNTQKPGTYLPNRNSGADIFMLEPTQNSIG